MAMTTNQHATEAQKPHTRPTTMIDPKTQAIRHAVRSFVALVTLMQKT